MGMKIKTALNEKGISQAEFCEETGISPATLSCIVRGYGRDKYSETMVLRVCSALSISLSG